MEIKTGFGWIMINGKKFLDDIVIDPKGNIHKRPKELSSHKKSLYNHTPLTRSEILRILEIVGQVDYFIIGTGQYGKLPIEKGVVDELNKRGIRMFIEDTPKAISKYIAIRDKYKVAAMFHVTC
ncbi:MAG: MTH938/NDUFAF3 family protein [Candidatus Njordarchaeales archaeon]